jgi:hypothetical protein
MGLPVLGTGEEIIIQELEEQQYPTVKRSRYTEYIGINMGDIRVIYNVSFTSTKRMLRNHNNTQDNIKKAKLSPCLFS